MNENELHNAPPSEIVETMLARLAEIGAILTAIDLGELLSDRPNGAAARVRHAAGAALLGLAQREVTDLVCALEHEAGGD